MSEIPDVESRIPADGIYCLPSGTYQHEECDGLIVLARPSEFVEDRNGDVATKMECRQCDEDWWILLESWQSVPESVVESIREANDD